MGDIGKSGHVLAQLKALGVRLSIDDLAPAIRRSAVCAAFPWTP